MLNKKHFFAMKTVLISCLTHNAEDYIKACTHSGIHPVLSDQLEDESQFDGLLLPGGGDIAPIFYHRKNRFCHNIHITEDIIQLLLFHRFYEQQKPILGICKGMQLINVALGGSLIQELPTGILHTYDNGDHYHNTKALSGSILHSLYGDNCITNSAHHQAVNKPGSQLSVTQYATDGTIEAIEHLTHPVIGVQWHPERLTSSGQPYGYANGLKLFQYFAGLL